MYGWLELDPEHPTRAYAHAQCGLCAHFGAAYRTRARMLAGADPTLLALFLEGLAPEAAEVARVRCPLTLKLTTRRAYVWAPLEALAELQLVLAGEKLFDDRLDKDGLFTRAVSGLLAKDLAAAEARLHARGFPVEALRAALRRQPEVEADPCADLDALSASTADGLALATAWLAAQAGADEARAAAAGAFADTLGRLLYLVDALHDRTRDRARGRFNPLDAALGALSPRRLAWLDAHLAGLAREHASRFEALALARHAEVLRAALVTRLAHKARAALEALDEAQGTMPATTRVKPAATRATTGARSRGEVTP